MIRIALALVAVASTATAGPRDDLAAARTELDALRYDQGLRLLDRAWRRGDSGPTEIRAIFALAGQAAGSIGDDDAAKLWFSRWLCLEPGAELPAGTSPKLTALLGEARRALAGAALTARASRRAGHIALEVTADPLNLVEAARIAGHRVTVDAGATTLPDGPGAVELLDRSGNVLVAIEPAGPPPAAVAPRIVATPATPWPERWTTWAIVAGGLGVVGGGAMWVALDARSSLQTLDASSAGHEYAEARALQDRFDRGQWVARFAFGGAAIAAVASGILWTRRIAVVPTADGGAVAWRF